MAAHIRCSKWVVAALLGASLAAGANDVLTEQDKAIAERHRAIVEAAEPFEPEVGGINDPVKMEQAKRDALRFFESLQRTNPTLRKMGELQAEKLAYTSHRTLVFASISLGEEGLEELLAAVAGVKDAVVVFRGIPEGMSFGEGVRAVQAIAAKQKPVPNVIINPALFKEHNVHSVPTIVSLAEAPLPGEKPKEVARVQGLSDPTWLEREIESGATGDLGARGPIAEIAEPDLIEVMKARAAGIDWEEQKRQAVARFWEKKTFHELPRAPESRTRTIDPSIVITSDITAADGQIIAARGSVVNPLEIRDFTQAVVVFDPLDKKQVALIERALPEIRKERGVQRVTFIVTRLDREEGWDSYTEVTDALDAPVFLLTPELVSRFELVYTPSVITARDRQFIVQELAEEQEQE